MIKLMLKERDKVRLLMNEKRLNDGDVVDSYEEHDVYGEELKDFTHEMEKRLIELIAYTPTNTMELSRIIESAKDEFGEHIAYGIKLGIRQTLTHLSYHDDITIEVDDQEKL